MTELTMARVLGEYLGPERYNQPLSSWQDQFLYSPWFRDERN